MSTKLSHLIGITLAVAVALPLSAQPPRQMPARKVAPRSALEIRALSPPPAAFTLVLGGPTGQKLRPLLGVNIGPIPAGRDPQNADLTQAYRDIGVTLVRTHDYYGPLDMSTMYPDRTRDPAQPTSYDFRSSDAVWHAITRGGFEPYLRLGDSFHNPRPPTNAAERANWVRAAVEVVRHYREGKWNGFRTPFRYVEIWNEPDIQRFWPRPRTPEEFYQLYTETAIALKQAFPDLKVGGPGVAPFSALAPDGQKWVRKFFQHVRQTGAPMDFFSWHLYANNPHAWTAAAQFYRRELDAHGFRSTPMHVSEWNTDTRMGSGRREDESPEAYAVRTGGKGAAILTAAWIAMQEQGIAEAAFYRGPDPDVRVPTFHGLFYADGRPKRIALAFSLWAQLAAHPERLKLDSTPAGDIWALAGRNSAGEIAILLANPTDRPTTYSLRGADTSRLLIQEVSDAQPTTRSYRPAAPQIPLAPYSVQLAILPAPK